MASFSRGRSRKASWALEDVQSFQKKVRESLPGEGSSTWNSVYGEPATFRMLHSINSVLTFHGDWNTGWVFRKEMRLKGLARTSHTCYFLFNLGPAFSCPRQGAPILLNTALSRQPLNVKALP